jgi:hypothetical protein
MELCMGLFDFLKGSPPAPRAPTGPFFDANGVPNFLHARLEEEKASKRPWVSSLTAAELGLARSHGLRMIATLTSSCWMHYGYSWTHGHAQGWQTAVKRMQAEAIALGANAVIDVRMITVKLDAEDSMDFSLVGTAVRVEGLPPSPAPAIATVPALEFVQLLEAGIIPVGIAIGACYQWAPSGFADLYMGNQLSGRWQNRPLMEVTEFWEQIRRTAHAELRRDTARQGMGVLAQMNFGQLFKIDRDKAPTDLLGRHIVLGTVVDYDKNIRPPQSIELVLDMRDNDDLVTQSEHHSTYNEGI